MNARRVGTEIEIYISGTPFQGTLVVAKQGDTAATLTQEDDRRLSIRAIFSRIQALFRPHLGL